MLSQKALLVLDQLFGDQSNLQLPAGIAVQVIEIRQWVQAQLASVLSEKEEKKK